MGGMTLQQALEEYKNVYLAARNYSARTRIEYSFDVGELIEFLEKAGIKKVGELSVPGLERYLADLDHRGIAGSTRKRKVVSVRSFLSFLYQNDYIGVNLAKKVIPPRSDYRNPRFLTENEYKRLLDASSHSSRDFAIIQLILQTGIKLSELTRLTVNDVDLPATILQEMKETGELNVRGNKRQKERIIPLNYQACQALERYLNRRSLTTSVALFLNRFGKRLSPRGVEKIVSKYCEQVGIEGVSVQSLRHTFGTHHAAKGTSIKTIQATMGLKDIRSSTIYLTLGEQISRREMQENSL
jgi:site-specific recombinase XerD